jgi:hypothetical protein
MAGDRRFVDVFDFKSVLTSAGEAASEQAWGTSIPSVYWSYIMTQQRGTTAALDPTGIAPNGGSKSGPVQKVRAQLLQTHVVSQVPEIPVGFQWHPLGRECGSRLTRRLCEIVRPSPV